jgi:precorrin-6A/cobalt-precorrin-6A reductase
MKVLVLGGTGEGRALADRLAGRPDFEATVSLAGRTAHPAPLPLPTRIGGFGGPEGLARHLSDAGIDALVDATHPFAERISANAVAAATLTGVPLVVLARPPWTRGPGDRWTEVADLAAAAAALGPVPRRVLLTVGRLGLAAFAAAPQHDYLVRTIDDPGDAGLPRARVILERPPFDAAAEAALMRREGIEVVVTKNSGGPATYGKIEAARALALRVVLVRPPARADVPTLHDPDAVIDWLVAHAGARRGV